MTNLTKRAQSKAKAVHLLQHYLQTLARHAGMKWDSDNDTEAGEIVDAIIDAAQPEEQTDHERAVERLAAERRRGGDTWVGEDGRKPTPAPEVKVGKSMAMEQNTIAEPWGGKAARQDDIIDPRD
jgi:hypothetical protein